MSPKRPPQKQATASIVAVAHPSVGQSFAQAEVDTDEHARDVLFVVDRAFQFRRELRNSRTAPQKEPVTVADVRASDLEWLRRPWVFALMDVQPRASGLQRGRKMPSLPVPSMAQPATFEWFLEAASLAGGVPAGLVGAIDKQWSALGAKRCAHAAELGGYLAKSRSFPPKAQKILDFVGIYLSGEQVKYFDPKVITSAILDAMADMPGKESNRLNAMLLRTAERAAETGELVPERRDFADNLAQQLKPVLDIWPRWDSASSTALEHFRDTAGLLPFESRPYADDILHYDRRWYQALAKQQSRGDGSIGDLFPVRPVRPRARRIVTPEQALEAIERRRAQTRANVASARARKRAEPR